MTRNRKAELQRKLTMAPVETPPSGLADRIKNEIPRDFRFAPERERAHLRQSVSFNLRIAASIILLTSSLYFAIHLFSRASSNNSAVAMKEERMTSPAARPAVAVLPVTPPQPGSGRLLQSPADQPGLPKTPPPRIALALSDDRLAEKKREESTGMAGGAPPAYVDTVARPAVAEPEPILAENAAPQSIPAAQEHTYAPERADSGLTAKTMAAPRAAAIAPPPPPPPPAAETASSRALDAAPRNFIAIQQSIVNGETPRYVDIATIVHHFSAPDRAASGLRIELEASSAPLDATKWLLRVSVDAPPSSQTAIVLTFGDAVGVHRALSGVPAPNETALYEIEFVANPSPDQTIAKVRAGNVDRTLRVADLHPWNAATPRMKRASLAAAWARTLQSHAPADAIVAKAREVHFDELADLAERAERNR
ncbi:MAG: hypothetical protein QOK37_4157 [Thermoanaerobaculia bacterium]|jgi:hypothetical protein|nr:hypothetical protein [Thermoanaerobaculia bacterium]